MTPLFADTYYYLALVNPRDQAHLRAKTFSQTTKRPMVTTGWVLTELADGLSHAANRAVFLQLYDLLRNDPNTTILPFNHALFDRGVALYGSRTDKDWSLTDCISFVVMRDLQIAEALTADHHFEQAGFSVVLK